MTPSEDLDHTHSHPHPSIITTPASPSDSANTIPIQPLRNYLTPPLSPTYISTFTHAHCSLCSSVTVFDHVVETSNYATLMRDMFARVHDLLDIFHPERPALEGIRLWANWSESGQDYKDLAEMGARDRATLLGLLAEGREGYCLRVDFETAHQEKESVAETMPFAQLSLVDRQ